MNMGCPYDRYLFFVDPRFSLIEHKVPYLFEKSTPTLSPTNSNTES